MDVHDRVNVATLENSSWPIAFSPDGNILASNTGTVSEKTVKIWNMNGYKELSSFTISDWVRSICFNPDGSIMAGASGDGIVTLWDMADYIAIAKSVESDHKLITSWGSIKDDVYKTTLEQNYPNPFNPETWIPYQLAQDTDVVISIYNLTGQLIRKLNLGYKTVGRYVNKDKAAYWDGRNSRGEKVTSGVYYYLFEAGNFRAIRKFIIIE